MSGFNFQNTKYRKEIIKSIISVVLAALAIYIFHSFGINGRVTYTILTSLGAYLSIKIVDMLLIAVRRRVEDENVVKTIKPLFDLTKGIIIFLAIIVLLSSFGINVTSILLGWGFILFVIAISLQSVISDVFSGISLVLSRKLKAGDKIILNNEIYEVIEISLQSTFLKNLRTKQITIIPNTELLKSKIDIIENGIDRFTVKLSIKNFNRIKNKLKRLGISFNILRMENDTIEIEIIKRISNFNRLFEERSEIIEEILKLSKS